MSNLSAFPYVAEGSEATPGLWNAVYSVLSSNIASVATAVDLGRFQQLSIGSTPPSYATTAAVTIEVNSTQSDYLYLVDSSAQRSSYIIGSRAGGTADGLNIWDVSGATMIASFSKQSIRFYQNVVAPVFDVGGALASTYNAATFGTGADSKESRIQSAINQASIDNITRVYVPANMYPYSASSVSFIYTVHMVREGGDWVALDVRAYGAYGDNSHIDATAIQSAFSAAQVAVGTAGRSRVHIPGGTYLTDQRIRFLGGVDVTGGGQFAAIIKLKNSAGSIGPIVEAVDGQAHYSGFAIDGNVANNSGQTQHGLLMRNATDWTFWDTVIIKNTSGNGIMTVFDSGADVPNQHTFTNVQVHDVNQYGLRMDAGQNFSFQNFNVERCGLQAANIAAVALTGTNQAARRIIFDNLWIESVGSGTASGSGMELTAAQNVVIRKSNILNYGLTAGGGGHGIELLGASDLIEIDGVQFAGRAASQSGQRKIKLTSATNPVLRNMALTSADLEGDNIATLHKININGTSSIGSEFGSTEPLRVNAGLALHGGDGIAFRTQGGTVRSYFHSDAVSEFNFYRSDGALDVARIQLTEAANKPVYAFGRESPLGWYRSAASNMALSYGTLDLASGNAELWGSGISVRSSIVSSSYMSSTRTLMGGDFWGSALSINVGLNVKAGTNKSCGTAVLGSNGSVNVVNTYVATGDLIFLTDASPGGTLGDLEVGGIRNGSGFTIQSTSVTDTSTVNWLIVRPT